MFDPMDSKYKSSKKYIDGCREWHRTHPSPRARKSAKALYRVPGCRIYNPPLLTDE